jgi:agmatine deiminase
MSMAVETPAALGYRLAAEWEPRAAVWIAWPHRLATWPDHFEPIPLVYAEVARRLAAWLPVRIVATGRPLAEARALLEGVAGIGFVELPTNDSWLRDSGPVFLSPGPGHETLPPAAVCFGYNAWGGKYPPWDDDAALGRRISEAIGLRVFDGGIVLEGGAIDTDGAGTLLVNRRCVIDEHRNPALSSADVERVLQEQLGIERIIWTGGELAGDDTDGHIDQLARFVARERVLAARQTDRLDPNHEALEDNLRLLAAARDAAGRLLEVIPIDIPPRFTRHGVQLPASFLNFLVVDQAVIVPVFGTAEDEPALRTIEQCFPERRIEPIDCSELIWGRGAIHCITRDQPRWPDQHPMASGVATLDS